MRRPFEAPTVTVAVVTYRRPGDLAELLSVLASEARTVSPPASVLVVDNDPDRGAEATVLALADELVRYVHEPSAGIAAARNRALGECHGHLLVFIDDDERPRQGWLLALTETYLRDRPTGVVGPVVSEPVHQPEPWIVAGRFFERLRHPTFTSVEVAATNNLLLDLGQIRTLDITFDERLGLSGGSDTLFTRQVTRRGGRLVWCDEAVVTDVVPRSRLTRRWVLRRAYRTGNSDARTAVQVAEGVVARLSARARAATRGAVRVVGGGLSVLLGAATGSLPLRARGARTVLRGAGMVAGAFGLVFSEYSRGVATPRAKVAGGRGGGVKVDEAT